jgi:hypothetical protein
LVTACQLAANEDGRPASWIVPQPNEREPNPSYGYVVSFVWRTVLRSGRPSWRVPLPLRRRGASCARTGAASRAAAQ